MSPAPIEQMPPPGTSFDSAFVSRSSDLRGVRWRMNLGILPSSASSTIDDLRRVTADSRRRYAGLRRRLLIDPHVSKDGGSSPDLVVDNPLSQNPDSMWGRFFRHAELEKLVDQDLSRLYPEHGSYFQTSGCQAMLRRILLLWSLRHPEYGYRQGMHELLAPLLYVLHSDLQHLSEVRNLYEDHFTDKFDDSLFQDSELTYNFDFRKSPEPMENGTGVQKSAKKVVSLDELDPSIRTIVLLSDAYGAEGELGIVLSEKFLEHDAYSMFDALMSGAGGAVAMAEFFSHSPSVMSQSGLPPVIEASSALYHLLSIVDSSLHSHLVELGVEPQYFALRWLRVLFGREFSLEDLLVIWDEIFSFDNSQSIKAAGDDLGSSFGILNSSRGAFISAMAVSMMLNVRSSLLAAENATSCLQRLLNFPENVNFNKLIGKAKSLMAIALDANSSSLPNVVTTPHNQGKPMVTRGHSLSFDSSFETTPIGYVPESYWEEKWRDLHKEEELKKDSSVKQGSSQKKGWTQKVKLRLSRTESDPSSSKRASRDKDLKSPIRRNLLEDLAQQLQLGEENEQTTLPKSLHHDDPLLGESVAEVQDDAENRAYREKEHLAQTTAGEENCFLFSDPGSPISGSNCLENDSEKSSFASNTSHDVNNGGTHTARSLESIEGESPLPISDVPDANVCPSCDSGTPEPSVTDPKEHKSLSGKFHWLWKFGRQTSVQGASDKGAAADATNSFNGASHQSNVLTYSADEQSQNQCPINVKGDAHHDQNLICTLRNLGQSMLENIQVIESVFQQDKSQAGTLDKDNFSKNALVEKGQVTALAALKELRKISNLLSEM
ncbi:hypothetical protein Ancab_027805 [Ancistrocladus abbreviatus]